jgi:hypothetical protein
MTIKPKQVFIVDYLGAMLSSFLLGIVLVYFQSYVGLPKAILYQLAIIALVLMTYSGLCILLIKKNHKPFLITIGIANIVYCIGSLYILNTYFAELTILGLSYFILEKGIVLTLAYLEIKTALK